MEINNKELRRMVKGAYYFETIGEYLAFYRCAKEQIDAMKFELFYYERAKFSTSIYIELETDAREIRFGYKAVCISERDTIDVFIDDELFTCKNGKDMAEDGVLNFSLPQGTKNVKIYFPIDAEIRIKDFRIDGNYRVIEDKRLKALWIGDSITQGYGSSMGGQTYVNIVSGKMHYDSINQGISGFYHHTSILKPLDSFIPDIVFVALGTNEQLDGKVTTRMELFYKKLQELYGDKPIYVITPIWRGDSEEQTQKTIPIGKMLKSICAPYDNIRVIDGDTLVPHVSQCYFDNLHPNAWGYELYANNLIKKLRDLNS